MVFSSTKKKMVSNEQARHVRSAIFERDWMGECQFPKLTGWSDRLGKGYGWWQNLKANPQVYNSNFVSGSICIEFIITETENWKYYSKIIFKCVNSIVGLIFNFFFWIKWLWVSWIVHKQCTLSPKNWNSWYKKKLKN